MGNEDSIVYVYSTCGKSAITGSRDLPLAVVGAEDSTILRVPLSWPLAWTINLNVAVAMLPYSWPGMSLSGKTQTGRSIKPKTAQTPPPGAEAGVLTCRRAALSCARRRHSSTLGNPGWPYRVGEKC